MKKGSWSLVTVIMPLKYYKLGFLRKSISSLKRQTCPDWNLLIAVERNKLNHFKTLLKNELKDGRIDITSGRKFAGRINVGMRRAKTEFVALLFADDKWCKDAVETLKNHIVKYPRIDFFHSSRRFIDENDNLISPIYRSQENFSLDDFKWGSPVKHLLCWRRTKGLSVGGLDESLVKAPDDYDFPWTMAEKGASFMAIKKCLYQARSHCEYYTRTAHIPLSEAKGGIGKILKKHGVGPVESWAIIAKRIKEGSLGGQAIYRSYFDKRLKEKSGIDDRKIWRRPNYR